MKVNSAAIVADQNEYETITRQISKAFTRPFPISNKRRINPNPPVCKRNHKGRVGVDDSDKAGKVTKWMIWYEPRK